MPASSLTQFTSYDEIRAVLGVAPEELEDFTLALPIHLRQLQFELSDFSDTLESTYLSIAASSSRTSAQQKLYDVIQVFAPYSVAKSLLTSVPLFAPRRITDGRADVERVVDPFMDVREGVDAAYAALRERLRAAMSAVSLTPTSATNLFSYAGTAGLSVNPVTNT